MLNKLLKRCLPWMDKGRWYKMTVVKSGENYINDPKRSDSEMNNAFYGINADGNILRIEFRLPDAGFIVKDVRFKIIKPSIIAYATSAHACALQQGDNVVSSLILCPESGQLLEDIESADDEFIVYLYAERVIL